VWGGRSSTSLGDKYLNVENKIGKISRTEYREIFYNTAVEISFLPRDKAQKTLKPDTFNEIKNLTLKCSKRYKANQDMINCDNIYSLQKRISNILNIKKFSSKSIKR
jgi:hypothetical protein